MVFWRLESTNHSAVRPTEPLSRPKALTGGQSLSSLAQQSERRHTPLRVQAANESRMRMATAVPALAYKAGCKCKCSLTLTQK